MDRGKFVRTKKIKETMRISHLGIHNFKKNGEIKIKAIHRRMDIKYGKPNYCEECKKINKKRYEWANIDHKYSLDIKYWKRLCTSCHRKFDIKNNNYKGFWWNTYSPKHPMQKICE